MESPRARSQGQAWGVPEAGTEILGAAGARVSRWPGERISVTDTSTDREQQAPELDDRQHRLRRTLESLTGIAFTEGNQITVLRNGDRIFPAMLAAIDNAEDSVDLMTYVYWKGDIATRFAEALCDAAGRG